jgi:hypothetical protein
MPPELRVTASADDDGEIMAVEHVRHPVVGVQFHPESASSEYGYAMLDRFLNGERSRGMALPPRADAGREPPQVPWWRRSIDNVPGGESCRRPWAVR